MVQSYPGLGQHEEEFTTVEFDSALHMGANVLPTQPIGPAGALHGVRKFLDPKEPHPPPS